MRLEVQHLAFAYPNGKQPFSDVSFQMEEGEILCLLGPNGCGKTTLLNCIAGLLAKKSGDILIDGKSLAKLTPSEMAQNIGYVPQNIIASFDYTVLDYVVTGCAPYLKLFQRPHDKEYARAEAALVKMGIERLSSQSYAQISGGERQLVSIARALVQQSAFILLDEPTAHLDYGNQMRLLSIVRDMAADGFGVLMTTHNPDHVLTLNSKLVMMQRGGEYVAGTAEDIVTEQSLCNLYGIDIMLEQSQKAGRPVCVTRTL